MEQGGADGWNTLSWLFWAGAVCIGGTWDKEPVREERKVGNGYLVPGFGMEDVAPLEMIVSSLCRMVSILISMLVVYLVTAVVYRHLQIHTQTQSLTKQS